MKTERLILSFIAILVGLLVAGIAFYFYQSTKTVPQEEVKGTNRVETKPTPTPTPADANLLEVEKPSDEDVATNKTITISGKTKPDSTIIVSGETSDEVVKPAANGNFSLSYTLTTGVNIIHITAVYANGVEKTLTRTVSYTTEDF